MRFRDHQAAAARSTRALLALFVLVLIGLVLATNAVLAAIYHFSVPFARGWPAYFFETNSALVLLFVLGGCWVESLRLREGGAHVARLAGGREAQAGGDSDLARLEKRFLHVVQEMAIASGQRRAPAAWVLPRDDAINAFAAGWGEADAVVCVTRGALERLTRGELEGVVAHEMSHLVHGDARLGMRLVGLVWGLQMVWGFGRMLASADDRGRRGPGLLFGLGLMAVGSLGWVAGRLLQAAVSRQREFLADASAVQYTRAVDGLGGALRKIADQQARDVAALRSSHAASLAHLLLAHRAARAGWDALWRTHPSLSERLRRLYGRPVAALPAELLPVVDDAPGPLVALAPAAPQALRDDPAQAAANFGAEVLEAEAMARLARRHGPGEWQAAMLALALGPQRSNDGGWRAATAGLPVADAVRCDIDALGDRARRAAFASLLESARGAPPAQQRLARRELLQRWRGCAPSTGARWRALVVALCLGPRPALAARAAPSAALTRHAAEAHAATRQLALALDVPAAARDSWQRAAVRALAELGVTPEPPARAARELLLALRVRRLAPMQRPLLLHAWFEAAERSGLASHAAAGDALQLACIALDVPVPERLLPPTVTA